MRIAMLVLVIFLGGCARSFVLDYQPDTDFSGYQSYAFAPVDDARSIDGARIERAVEREIASSLSRADPEQADLLVRYRVEDSVRLETSGFGYGLGFGRDRLGIGLSTVPDAREVKEGKLVIEMVEREGRQVVWRAVGQRNLTEQMKPESRNALIDRLVRDMFGRFPP